MPMIYVAIRHVTCLGSEVLDQGGHYLWVVKDNQPTLKEVIAAEFQADFSPGKPPAIRGAA
jgi:hypothetical protein